MQEKQWQRLRRLGKEPANPFNQTKRPNQVARYLNKRQTEMHRTLFDRAGNPTLNEL